MNNVWLLWLNKSYINEALCRSLPHHEFLGYNKDLLRTPVSQSSGCLCQASLGLEVVFQLSRAISGQKENKL